MSPNGVAFGTAVSPARSLSPPETARFQEISIPGYERIGAPRVSFDSAADVWKVKARKAGTPEDIAATLKKFHGYYVLRLVNCDGVPKYSSGGLYDGVDETTFRRLRLATFWRKMRVSG
jgi:hypothetical protein